MHRPEAKFPLGRVANLAVFASGAGSNLQSLLAAFPHQSAADALGRVMLVVSDRPEAGALELARIASVPTLAQSFKPSRAHFEAVIQDALQQASIDLVLLAGFMRILSGSFTDAWRGRLLNIHPSLLPAHPGLHAVAAALQAGDFESGCTVHLVDAGVDTGPVLAQARVPIAQDDTEATLHARIRTAEHGLYPQTVRRLLEGAFETQRAFR